MESCISNQPSERCRFQQAGETAILNKNSFSCFKTENYAVSDVIFVFFYHFILIVGNCDSLITTIIFITYSLGPCFPEPNNGNIILGLGAKVFKFVVLFYYPHRLYLACTFK